MSKEEHSLVVVAEGIWDAQFRNIHQSTLSIPGVGVKKTTKNNEWRTTGRTAGEKLEEEISSSYCHKLGSCLTPSSNSLKVANKKEINLLPWVTKLQSEQVLNIQDFWRGGKKWRKTGKSKCKEKRGNRESRRRDGWRDRENKKMKRQMDGEQQQQREKKACSLAE